MTAPNTHLLPTPAVNDMGAGKTVDDWDEWTDRMKTEHANGNGHGKSLAIEAQRLAECQTHEIGVEDGDATEVGPDQVLRDVRRADGTEAVQRSTRGSHQVPLAQELLPDVREQQASRPGRHTSLASPQDPDSQNLRGVRDEYEVARRSRRQRRDEQRPDELTDPLRELPPETPLGRGPCRTHGVDFGQYEAAIQRWESVLGREAPTPTEPTGKGAAQRLSPRFVEFLMGLPEGWVTDVPGITRNEALKALGNGVVPQQAEAALRHMLAQELAA